MLNVSCDKAVISSKCSNLGRFKISKISEKKLLLYRLLQSKSLYKWFYKQPYFQGKLISHICKFR